MLATDNTAPGPADSSRDKKEKEQGPKGLWLHQLSAISFVVSHWANGLRGVMLAMIMGSGKSRVTIEVAHRLNLTPILILAPLRVVGVWQEQFQRHLPGTYEFLSLDDRVKSVNEKARLARERMAWCTAKNRPLVVCINYESARLQPFAHWALANFWGLVVADESQRCKQPGGTNSRLLARLGLQSRYRLALSGTPFPHSPLDIWAQYRFLDRTIYDNTFSSFQARYATMGGFFAHGKPRQVVGWRNLDDLEERFRSIAFQAGREVLDLPAEQEQDLYTELEAGAGVYAQLEANFIALLESGEVITAANKLVQLLRLQQVTSGAVKSEAGRMEVVDHAKRDLLQDLLEDLPAEEPVVVFCRFRYDLGVVHDVACALGRRSGELSGEYDDLKAWQQGGPQNPVILAVQIQSGGVGIDLTRAAYGIYYSLGFSLGDYLQSRARIYRSGQKRPVMFYHLFARSTVDEMIARALAARQDLVETVLKELKCRQQPNRASNGAPPRKDRPSSASSS